MMFPNASDQSSVLGFLNSKPAKRFLDALNPTLSTQNEDIDNLPYPPLVLVNMTEIVSRLAVISKDDWDAYETSWDFTELPLFSPDYRAETLEGTYTALCTHWQGMTD